MRISDWSSDVCSSDLTDLAEMMQVAAMIEASEPVPEHLRRLLRPVQSLGGARPKASFRDERGFLWVAKFPSQEDVFNMAGAEAACLDMAVECGIAVPERKEIGSASCRERVCQYE